ncbi:hypothetical protein CMV_012494 [Castanea mollissima]|uniref:Uncharacterized protein n=1 Tax=Castanea mollissima TaxID=60419 RepID=A0A8J4VZ48_9ROSI|nr:hypothetical protein CMV_012494 [Castanea mollissima]
MASLTTSDFTQNLKFRPYSKLSGLAIVQHVPELQVKNSMNHSKFLRTLKEGLDRATNTAGISLLNREQIKDKLGLPCSKLYGPEIKLCSLCLNNGQHDACSSL